MNIEILCIHEDFVTKTIFTLMLLHEWPCDTKFSKPIAEDQSREELNIF